MPKNLTSVRGRLTREQYNEMLHHSLGGDGYRSSDSWHSLSLTPKGDSYHKRFELILGDEEDTKRKVVDGSFSYHKGEETVCEGNVQGGIVSFPRSEWDKTKGKDAFDEVRYDLGVDLNK